MIYTYPKLSNGDFWFFRFGGDGMGNLLFTWARALVFSHCHGYPMIEPTWFSIKPKAFYLHFYDTRTYGGIFDPLPRALSK